MLTNMECQIDKIRRVRLTKLKVITSVGNVPCRFFNLFIVPAVPCRFFNLFIVPAAPRGCRVFVFEHK